MFVRDMFTMFFDIKKQNGLFLYVNLCLLQNPRLSYIAYNHLTYNNADSVKEHPRKNE